MDTHRLLLVEDSHLNQAVVTTILDNAGYHTDLADNGREALKAVRSQHYDLILMDLDMPEMNGFEATEAVRRLKTPIASVPIIAVTANISAQARERAQRVGMNDYLTKPIDAALLLATIKHWLTSPIGNKKIPVSPAKSQRLDTSTLKQLEMDTDPVALQRIIGLFIDETRARLVRIADASRMRDWQRLQYEAHALKSAAAALGVNQLQQHARQLDAACQQGDNERSLVLANTITTIALPALKSLADYAEKKFKL